MQRVFRCDRGQLSKATRTDAGYLRCPGVITRTGVFEYRLPDGTTRRELRLPEEVFDAASVASFDLAPLTNDHPPERLLTPDNTRLRQVGTVANLAPDGSVLGADVQITDADAIASVEAGKRELSCGYTAELEPVAGVTDGIDGVADGLRYDAIQRCIRGNHVAIVDEARAGDMARLKLDSADAVCVAQLTQKEPAMATVKIDGVTYEAPDQTAELLSKLAGERDQARADATKAEQAAAAATKAADEATARADMAEEKAADAEKQLAEAEAAADEKTAEAVGARLELERLAGELMPDADVSAMSVDDIRKAIIMAASADADACAEKMDGKSADYIAARFDAAVEVLREKAKAKSDDTDADAGAAAVRAAAASADVKADASDAARKAMIENQTNAWTAN